MYTSLMLLALSGGFAPFAATPQWLTDYSAASRQGVQESKPLAVFIGSGEGGWDKLSRDGKLSKEVQDILATMYVCVYVDTGTDQGKRLATAFEVPRQLGLVISDRSGEKQAFHHQGDLKGADLAYYLRKYADTGYVVRTTESNPPARTSVQTYTSFSYSILGGFGGGGC